MKEIILLTDYKNYFGSNYDADPYRSGFSQTELSRLFLGKGYIAHFMRFADVQKSNINWQNKIVLYTSNEEPGYYYKDYIEDMVLFLMLKGAFVIPNYHLLRANNNKSFMELYKTAILNKTNTLKSLAFGSLDELILNIDQLSFPIVFKTSAGAMSSGVALANSRDELIKIVKKHSGSASLLRKLKEVIRARKHKGYIKDSFYQKKFILQSFVPNLENDWKVLIFGEQVYILKRGVRKNDFRASGSHVGYKAGSESGFPLDYLDSLMEFMEKMQLPNVSIDFAFDGVQGYIIEFQGVYFGTSTHNYCKDYYIKEAGKWIAKPNVFSKEELFVYSICNFLNNRQG